MQENQWRYESLEKKDTKTPVCWNPHEVIKKASEWISTVVRQERQQLCLCCFRLSPHLAAALSPSTTPAFQESAPVPEVRKEDRRHELEGNYQWSMSWRKGEQGNHRLLYAAENPLYCPFLLSLSWELTAQKVVQTPRKKSCRPIFIRGGFKAAPSVRRRLFDLHFCAQHLLPKYLRAAVH